MTEGEFEILEQECKREWHFHAEEGDSEKTPDMDKYTCQCPACDIAYKAIVKANKHRTASKCIYCPVDIWRKEAVRLNDFDPVCEGGTNPHYELWCCADTAVERKAIAGAIEELSWTYLDIYKEL